MPGLVPGIHDFRNINQIETWMAGTRQAMTNPLESQAVASAGRRRDRCSSHVMIETFTRFQPRPLRNAAR